MQFQRPEPRLRVVFLGHTAAAGGGELSLLTLLPLLDVDKHVILAGSGLLIDGFSREAAVELLPLHGPAGDLSVDGEATVAGTASGGLSLLSNAVRLAARLRVLRPDVVHTNTLRSALYGSLAARMAGIPCVVHVRDRIAPDYLSGGAARAIRVALGRLPTRIIANSQTTASLLGDRRPTTVIPSPLPYLPTAQRSVTDGPLTFASASRISPWKGQLELIHAFAQAFPDTDDRLTVFGAAQFGEHAFERTLHDAAARLGVGERVTFTGHVEDMVAALAEVDVVVHCPRVPEPFGRVVVEALATGAAVIARGDGGPAEIITDGHSGVLVRPGSPEALVAALKRVRSDKDLRERLARTGPLAAAAYAPAPLAARVEDVLRQAAGRTGRRS